MTHFDYIRKYYHVPAKRGGKVRFNGQEIWTISSAHGGMIVMWRIDERGKRIRNYFHPTWRMEYLEEERRTRQGHCHDQHP